MNSNSKRANQNWGNKPPTADCQTNQRRISDYLSHSIAPDEYAALQSHLSICSSCSSLLRSYSTLDSSLKQLPNPPTSPRLRRAVLAAVHAAEADRHALKPVPAGVTNRAPRLAGSMAAVAALVVFAASFAMLLGGHGLRDTNVAYASPTISVPSTVTPNLDDAIKLGVSQQTPAANSTPLPVALLVSQSPADSNAILFSSVDSAGMTQTLASPAGTLVNEAKAAVSHNGQRIAYVTDAGDKAKLQVYDLPSAKLIASVDVAAPIRDSKSSYAYGLAPSARFSPADKYLAYSLAGDYGVLDLATGVSKSFAPDRSMLPKMGCCTENLVGWGADNFVYMGSLGEGQPGARLFTFSLNSGQAKTPAENYDLIDNPWMNDSGTAIYAASLATAAVGMSSSNGQSNRTKLVRYDVASDKFSTLLDFADAEQLVTTKRDDIGTQGIFAETADGSTLLFVATTAEGRLELRRIGLRGQFSDKLAIYLPPASSNPEVTALQVCGSVAYYQVSINDANGDRQTTLVAQPLTTGTARPLASSGQLIGCTMGR